MKKNYKGMDWMKVFLFLKIQISKGFLEDD